MAAPKQRVPLIGQRSAAGGGGGGGGAWEVIYDHSEAIDWTPAVVAIPSGYAALQFIVQAKSADTTIIDNAGWDYLDCIINGDTTFGHYVYSQLFGGLGTSPGGATGSEPVVGAIPNANISSGRFSQVSGMISDPDNIKTLKYVEARGTLWRGIASCPLNLIGMEYSSLTDGGGDWAPISSLQLKPRLDDWVAYSRVTILGLNPS